MVVKNQGSVSQNASDNGHWNSSFFEHVLEDSDFDFNSLVTESPKKGPCCDGDGGNVKDKKELQPKRISVEMVDRGVGPTPVPNPVPGVGFPGPFLGIPPYLPDPRANVFESSLGYAGCLFSSLPYSLNPPIMVNSTTNEGRYHWPPGATPLQGQPSGPGVGVNDTFADLTSGVPLRSPFPGDAATAAALASRFHWEQYQRLAALHQHGALTMQQGMGINPNGITPFHCRISPSGFPVGYQDGHMPPNPFSPHLAFTATSQKSAFSEHPATPGSGSITLPGSLEGSRLNSPHPSVTVKNSSRKRALSHSPLDFGLDIENLTRSSGSSLHLQSFGQASRTSSNASGSYGHLSAMSLSALGSGIHMFGHPALRHGTVPPGVLYSPILHPCFLPPYQALGAQGVAGQSSSLQDTNSSNYTATTKPEPKNSATGSAHEVGCCSIVSSTVGTSNVESRRIKMKKEEVGQHAAEELSEDTIQMQEAYDGNEVSSRTLQEREPDFYETNCHWKDCSQQYETQEELVKHLNQDHIASNKKFFVCEWEGCLREKKPFKAQYMLVVHMRRHTGEKPHQCQFQGCSKAYSRLENLKTHLRSHTGEKPYLCEHPGCSKAFSNASDRAKHQNRTHSNAKPYACKAPGCTKCYTDPSSLRKHVKTVHGADFYANKKHKGEAFCSDREQNEDGYSSSRNYGGNAGGSKGGGRRQRYTLMDRQPDLTENSNGGSSSSRSLDVLNVQDCLRVTPLHPASNLARKKFSRVEAEGSKTTRQHCTRPDPNVGNLTVTRYQQDVADFDNNTENLVSSTIGGQILTETEEDILSEFLLPATTVVAVSQGEEHEERASVVCTGPGLPPLGFRSKLGPKGKPGSDYPALPPLGNTSGRILPLHGVRRGNPDTSNQKTDIKARTASRKIVDSSSMLIREALHSSRRDSSTSTLSSYMSSIRSDSSPFQQLYHSSRRPSDSSQNSTSQRSFAQSPYEYDISECHPGSSLRGSDMVNTLSGMLTSRMTRLGNSMASLHNSSGSDCRGRGGLVRFLMSQQDRCDRHLPPVTGGYSTPCRTPLPHEIPNHDIRRASDPVRTGLGSLSTVREFQRCHSLNAVRRQTAPKPSDKHVSTDLYSNYNSSCTSIATDFSLASEVDIGNAFLEETDDVIDCCTMVNEALLEKQMFQDACQDDLIIPDEMQEYLDANGLGSVATLNPDDHFDLDHADLMGQAKETRSGQFVSEPQNASTHLQQTRVLNGWNGNDVWPPCTSMEVSNQQDYNEGIAMELEGYDTNMQNNLHSASNSQLPLHAEGRQNLSWLSGEKFSRLKRTENQNNQPSTQSLGSQMYTNGSRNCLVQPLSSRHPGCINRTQSHSLQPEVQVSQISQSKLASARLLGTTAVCPSAQGTAVTDRRVYANIASSNNVTANSSVTAQRPETVEKQLLQQNGFYRANLTEQGTLENKSGSQEGAGASMEMSLIKEQYLSGLVYPCFSEDNLLRYNTAADQSNGDPSHQVSSSTDVGGLCAANEDIGQLTETVNSMGDCLLDSLGSISLENVMSSPSMMTNHSTSSTVSRMTTPRAEDRSSAVQSSYLKTSNMAVNDMTSLLAQLVQENKYRNMCG